MWADFWFLRFAFELSYNLCKLFDNFQVEINCHHGSKNISLTQKPKARVERGIYWILNMA